jgi:hypothetical protein
MLFRKEYGDMLGNALYEDKKSFGAIFCMRCSMIILLAMVMMGGFVFLLLSFLLQMYKRN